MVARGGGCAGELVPGPRLRRPRPGRPGRRRPAGRHPHAGQRTEPDHRGAARAADRRLRRRPLRWRGARLRAQPGPRAAGAVDFVRRRRARHGRGHRRGLRGPGRADAVHHGRWRLHDERPGRAALRHPPGHPPDRGDLQRRKLRSRIRSVREQRRQDRPVPVLLAVVSGGRPVTGRRWLRRPDARPAASSAGGRPRTAPPCRHRRPNQGRRRPRSCTLTSRLGGRRTREGSRMNNELPLDTVNDVLDYAAKRYGDRTALGDGPSRYTVPDLHAQAFRAADGLRALGVRPGDRVAIWLPNRVEWCVAFYAAVRAGPIVVPLTTGLSVPQPTYHLAQSGSTVVVTADEYRSRRLAGDALAISAGAVGGLRGLVFR